MQKDLEQILKATFFSLILMSILASSGCGFNLKSLNFVSTVEPDKSAPLETISNKITNPENEYGPSIAEIQGEFHYSPYVKQKVEDVHGVVTVIRADGFYLQSMYPDENLATSEGIYVYQGLVPTVKPGEEVLVTGTIKEGVLNGDSVNDLTITYINYPSIKVLSNNNRLPNPVVIGEGGRKPPVETIDNITNGRISGDRELKPGEAGLDFFESLEGMLVQVNHAVVVGATNRYKEIVVLPDDGSWAGVRTTRGGVVIQHNDFNPERVILDDALLALPFVQVGDNSTKPIIGVMDYSFGNYKLLPIENVEFASGGLEASKPLPAVEPGQIRVASYNVEMVSPKEPNRIVTLADQIVNVMASPDIIGLQEIADNDGLTESQVVSADETWQLLIGTIVELGGPHYAYADIDPAANQDGGAPGANIRVGFLYRTDRGLILAKAPHGDAKTAISVIDRGGVAIFSHNPGRVEPDHNVFRNSRKPLAAMFLLDGEPLYVINNHFISKGADTGLFGANQPPLLNSEDRRNQQAQVVQDFVTSILEVNPNSRIIVMGDLNDFQFSSPLDMVKGEHLFNLVDTLPVKDRYTYVYDGNSQALDHILVSETLFSSVISVDILHLNSEFDYTRRFSDHDPVTATFLWNAED